MTAHTLRAGDRHHGVVYALAVAVTVGTILWILGMAAIVAVVPSQTEHYPACAHEWSRGPCFWDAHTQGNGRGRSFFVDSQQGIHYVK